MDKISIISKFKQAHNEYFKLLLETYPTKHPITEDSPFGNPRACELAIQTQSCLIVLGAGAQNRMITIGFDLLYPFNNIVDQYNWRSKVIKEEINFTTFASIAIRIDAEIQIMERTFEMDGHNQYNALSDEIFIKPKSRYLDLLSPTSTPTDKSPSTQSANQSRATGNTDNEAIDRIINFERRTNILSNIANLATTVKTLFY